MNQFTPKGTLKIVQDSILHPHNSGLSFVLSVNNLVGKVEGNPLIPLFNKKWRKVAEETKGWYHNKTGAYKLGAISTVAVQSDTWIIQMLCMDEKLQYSVAGMQKCLKEVCKLAKYEKASVHISTLLTNEFPELIEMATNELVNQGVSVRFYEEPIANISR